MKNLVKLAFLAICMLAMTACSVDTHYDSVSTYVDINITEKAMTGDEITIYQRFQFDRDLVPLQTMELESAWISAPDLTGEILNEGVDPYSFTLNTLRLFKIQITTEDNEDPTPWLSGYDWYNLKGEHAQLDSSGYVSDVREYIDDYQQLELQIVVTMDPYHVSRYWRDVCNFSEDCTIRIPLSMHFRMED